MEKSLLDRINELARKSRTPEGLTEAEKAEQQKLRQQYLAEFRARFRAQLENTDFDIREADGSIHPLHPKKPPVS